MPELTWTGKAAVKNHHQAVPYRLLQDDPVRSFGPDSLEHTVASSPSENLLIQGDNLLALKALLPYYAGQVKCIYIDPPYNTGNEGWVYNDKVNSPEMREWLDKVVGKEAEDLNRHDKWLCMMYPRLQLLKQFLREDGCIAVSIDDNAVGYLRLLMDEIFGADRFIANCIWQKRYSRENRGAIGDAHEYVMFYAPSFEKFREFRNKIPLDEKQLKLYKNPNDDPNGLWQSVSLTAQGFRPNQMYEIIAPNGRKHLPPEGTCWKLIKSEFENLVAQKKVYFGKDGNGVPRRVYYLKDADGIVPWTWWPHEEVGHTDESRKEVQSIFGTQTAFDTPKPTRLIKRILQLATKPGDLVLDCFAGSGTTGHAVLQLNKEDGGDRRFILVEMDENIAQNITSERLRRVIAGYGETPGLGGGFRYCTLGEPLFSDEGAINPAVSWEKLARHIFFSETGEPLPEGGDGDGPLLGTQGETAIYLLYKGDGTAILDGQSLKKLPAHPGGEGLPRLVFAEACRLSNSRRAAENIIFKQVPYEVKTR